MQPADKWNRPLLINWRRRYNETDPETRLQRLSPTYVVGRQNFTWVIRPIKSTLVRLRDLFRLIIARAREAARVAAERARVVNLVDADELMRHYYTLVDPDPLIIANMFYPDGRRRPNRRNR